MVIAKFATTTKHGAIEGKTQTHFVDYYNLDMIISVGYRVKSQNGILFRKWANKILKVIGDYSKALNLLDDYDHRTLKKITGKKDERKMEYIECLEIIKKLKFYEKSILFAVER